MLAIAVFSGVMTIIIFGLLIAELSENPPHSKLRIAFATVGFLLLGGIFIASSLNAKPQCDHGEQRVMQGENTFCIPSHEARDYLESNK